MYLYHYPVFYLYGFFKLNIATTLREALVLECVRIPAVILLSILSYEFIEKPILELKRNISFEKYPDSINNTKELIWPFIVILSGTRKVVILLWLPDY